MAAMEELGTLLHSLQGLKAPGITKSKITAIVQLCHDNIQSDSTVLHKLVQQFQNSPATHKLGVVYVLDSVVRGWIDKSKAAGQSISKNAAPGTFASGVQKITDFMPTVMTKLVQSAPEDQKDRISKLIDIWERGQTFPPAMIATFKDQLNKSHHNALSAPSNPSAVAQTQFAGGQANPQMVAPPAPAPAVLTAPAPATPDTGALLAALAVNLGQQNGQTNLAPAVPTAAPYPNIAPPHPGYMAPSPVATNAHATQPAMQVTNELIQQILQAMASGVLPADQGLAVLAAMAQSQQSGGAPAMAAQAQPPMVANAPLPSVHTTAQNGAHPDRYEDKTSRFRDRSRSPEYQPRRQSPNRRSPPHRRESPTYGVYDPNAGSDGNITHGNDRDRGRGRGRNRGRGRDRDEYRQRSPPVQRRQASPDAHDRRNSQPKFIEWDQSLPRDHIKVLSRTLFVGGAGGTEQEIRNIFSSFGKVQTCIVNQDKRHAFVKMVNREDAISAKNGMDNIQDPNALAKARQTRWGVGFGPRDCSDYNTGVSVIPISRLTDADRKWVVTAEFGGTGGRALEGGMVLEEPDIEIGAGVSSKAISRRVPPDAGRGRGHGHAPRGGFDNSPRFRKEGRAPMNEPRNFSPRPEPTVAVPPAVPGFGFQLPGF